MARGKNVNKAARGGQARASHARVQRAGSPARVDPMGAARAWSPRAFFLAHRRDSSPFFVVPQRFHRSFVLRQPISNQNKLWVLKSMPARLHGFKFRRKWRRNKPQIIRKFPKTQILNHRDFRRLISLRWTPIYRKNSWLMFLMAMQLYGLEIKRWVAGFCPESGSFSLGLKTPNSSISSFFIRIFF